MPSGIPGVGPTLPYPVKAAATRARSVAWLACTRGRPRGDGLRILCYHRVSDDPDDLAVGVRRFAEQMEHLAAEGYRVVDVPEAVRLLDTWPPGERAIGLSFDDGYADLAENALPVLERLGFRATVFIATAVTDGRARFAWYDTQPPLLGWEDIAALDRGGVLGFEAHTLTHPNLLAIADADARREIAHCKRELEERLGRGVTAFAYPAGLFAARERRFATQSGYSAAVTVEPGVNLPGTDRFSLRRRQIDARDRLLEFRAKVGGGHDTPLPLRNTYRRWRFGAPPRSSARA